MGLVGVVLVGCAPTAAPKETSEVITISDSGSIHGETTTRLFPDDVLVESDWEVSETLYGDARKNLKRTEQLRGGAFQAVLGYLQDHPFVPKEPPRVQPVCYDFPTLVISYQRQDGEGFVYLPPCWDEKSYPYYNQIFTLIEEYRVK